MAISNMDIWQIVKAMNKNLPEAEKCQLLSQLHPMIDNWNQQKCREQIPNWRGDFTNENIDCLLKEELKDKEMKVINFLITNDYEDEPELDNDGKPILRRTTAVHLAAELKLMPQLDRLFEIYNKFHVNYEDDTGLTHFHAACMSARHDVVKEFLHLGQDPNGLPLGQIYRDPPLTFAVRHKRIKVVELLLKAGAEPNLAYEEDQTPLHFLCKEYDYDEDFLERFFKICELNRKPVRVNAQTESGWTPLHESLKQSNEVLVEFLLDKGANPNAADLNQTTPLHVICCQEHEDVELMQRFFDCCEDNDRTVNVNAVNDEGKTPLQWCQEHGHTRMAEVLRRRFAV